jgi:hypothetical protein
MPRSLVVDSLMKLVETTWSHVNEEMAIGLFESALGKAEIIVSPILLRNRSLDATPWLEILDRLLGNLPKPEAAIKRAAFYQLQADFNLADGQKSSSVTKEHEAFELLDS